MTRRPEPRGDPVAAAHDDDRRRLEDGARALGVALAPEQVERLLRFRDLLVRWNAVHNLTAVREPSAMVEQHLLDSLAVVPTLQRERPYGPLRVLDVGSGGGLPGVVLAIALPRLEVVCVDAVAKKTGFVRQAAAELHLDRLHAVHARVEDLAGGRFDVIVARAFATLADLVASTRAQLADGGVWLAMKGRHPDAEIGALPPDVEVFHVEPLHVPGLGAERCLVWMRPATAPSGDRR